MTFKTKIFTVCIKENEQGIIIDVFDTKGELIDTMTYWNEDHDMRIKI